MLVKVQASAVCGKVVDLEPLITHRFCFGEFNEAFRVCKALQTGKVLLMPE